MSHIHETEIFVRFCETDAIGHVNNTSYFLYFEEARSKFFNQLYPSRSDNLSFIIANIECSYLNEAFANQTLIVGTFVNKIGNTSFTIKHTLENEDNNVMIAEAETVIVCYDYPNKKSIKIPNILHDNIKKYLPRKVNV